MTLAELEAAMLEMAAQPQQIRNSQLFFRGHSLKDLVELHSYLTSLAAVDSGTTSVDGETAVMPGIRTNRLNPSGSV